MRGRIKVGRWMEFTAQQQFNDEHAFEWRARAGWRRFKPVHVVDTYASGAGGTVGKLFGRVPFLHAVDANTARAAAARGVAESIWVPASLMPQRGVERHAEPKRRSSPPCTTSTTSAGGLLASLPSVSAHLGSIDALIAGRPGSWEADLIRVKGSVGWDDDYLADYLSPR